MLTTNREKGVTPKEKKSEGRGDGIKVNYVKCFGTLVSEILVSMYASDSNNHRFRVKGWFYMISIFIMALTQY